LYFPKERVIQVVDVLSFPKSKWLPLMNPLQHSKVLLPKMNYYQELSVEEKAVLKTLLYFDIFHYPLQADEIRKFLCIAISRELFFETLLGLLAKKMIFSHIGYYSIHDNPLLVQRRAKANKKAESLLIKAKRIGKFLYHFPFVRAVAISGSLSKNVADEYSDIDFFIITGANRLWVARTMMHLFKKLTYITGSQHQYCMNFYINESNLKINEENIFTAIEIKTLVPVSGNQVMNNFLNRNSWADDWLPGFSGKEHQQKKEKKVWIKKLIEWVLRGKFGEYLDKQCHLLTKGRWKKKMDRQEKNSKGDRMKLLTEKHFSRSNPENFQEKVLKAYREKLTSYHLEPD